MAVVELAPAKLVEEVHWRRLGQSSQGRLESVEAEKAEAQGQAPVSQQQTLRHKQAQEIGEAF